MSYIRLATHDDLEVMQDLNQQILIQVMESGGGDGLNIDNPYTPRAVSYFEKAVNQGEGLSAYIFEEEGVAKGYMTVRLVDPDSYFWRPEVRIVDIETLSVDKNYRGQKIGTQLIDFAKELAKEKGANRLRLTHSSKNIDAARLYQKIGFEPFDIIQEMKL